METFQEVRSKGDMLSWCQVLELRKEPRNQPEVGISLSERKRIREREDELKSLVADFSKEREAVDAIVRRWGKGNLPEMMRKTWLLLEKK